MMTRDRLDKAHFANKVIRWHRQHGRHDLPWQQDKSLYRVWVSEVMLQQTRVATVIAYFDRFVAKFPDIQSLAAASNDEVMHLWSGLGYYSRAANLHRCARQIVNEFGGVFPRRYEQLLRLPGVGSSTAGAILSLSLGQPHVLLDANVKRVLARYYGYRFAITTSAGDKFLWRKATQLLPRKNADIYNQGMMDVGAQICLAARPECDLCPLQGGCKAYKEGAQDRIPVRRRRGNKPVRECEFLLLFDNRYILLKKRPAKGIWRNLWCLPTREEAELLEISWVELTPWAPQRITFSHYSLDCRVVPCLVKYRCLLNDWWLWYNSDQPQRIGLPAVMERLLAQWSFPITCVAEEENSV